MSIVGAQADNPTTSAEAPAAEDTPTRTRDRQTRRTRRALIAAADEIFAEGGVPTVADVAERADVARATAYRYFPTQEALLLETTYLGDSEPLRALPELVGEIEDPAERVGEAVRRGAEWTLGREARLRAILRLSLDPEREVRRPARRRGYIAQLLESVRGDLAPEAYQRLATSLSLVLGIDPIVSVRDNSEIDPARIPELLGWVARELVRSALREAGESEGG
jgi:AcrR family transcriptional regulator